MSSSARHTAHTKRIPLYDNAKFVLIASVVVGHLLKLCNLRRRRFARATFIFIYTFHMPLFIFLAGLFVNRERLTWESTKRNSLRYAALGMLAKLIRSGFPVLMGKHFHFHLLSEGGIAWFMFALSAYYMLAWVLRDFSYLEIGCTSLCLSLAAGYAFFINNYFCLSRIIVFFPFFWLGHALDARRVEQWLTDKRVRRICLIIVVLFALFCLVDTKAIYRYRRLFFGNYRYARVRLPGWLWLHRGLAYLISLVAGAAVLGVIPRKKLPHITLWGQRTLQVYLLHHPILDVLKRLHIIRFLYRWGHWGWLTLVFLGVAIACLLAMPDLKGLISRFCPARVRNAADVPRTRTQQ